MPLRSSLNPKSGKSHKKSYMVEKPLATAVCIGEKPVWTQKCSELLTSKYPRTLSWWERERYMATARRMQKAAA